MGQKRIKPPKCDWCYVCQEPVGEEEAFGLKIFTEADGTRKELVAHRLCLGMTERLSKK